jgi:hypothetical protein
MRFVIDAISDIARGEPPRLESSQEFDRFDQFTANDCDTTAEVAAEQTADRSGIPSKEINPEKQRLALNGLLESSFAHVEQLIDNNEFSEAIEFSIELTDRFHSELLCSGFAQVAASKGTSWLHGYADQLRSSTQFLSNERNLREEKYLRQLLKLPASLRSTISLRSDSAPRSQFWTKVQSDARSWLKAIQSSDIDLDKFVEALGIPDLELEKLRQFEHFTKHKLAAATRLIEVLTELPVERAVEVKLDDFSIATSRPEQNALNNAVGKDEVDDSLITEIKKLGLTLNDFQCQTIQSLLIAIAGQDLGYLKRILTSFKGTPGDFNLVGQALERILQRVGISVTGSYGPYWAFLSLETGDYQHGIQLAMPSGKISGHLRGTTYNSDHAASALRALSRCVTGH